MGAYPGEGFHPGNFGERRRPEGNSEVFEEIWRSASREVMAHQAETRQIFLVHMRQQVLPAIVVKPKAQKCRVGGVNQIAYIAV